jgi:hypothetical protein
MAETVSDFCLKEVSKNALFGGLHTGVRQEFTQNTDQKESTMIGTTFVTAFALAVPLGADWVTHGGSTHNYLTQHTSVFEAHRVIRNEDMHGSMSYSAKTDYWQKPREVSGSANDEAPWSDEFKPRSSTMHPFERTTGAGSVPANPERRYEIQWHWQTGKEQWLHVPSSEEHSRNRNWYQFHEGRQRDILIAEEDPEEPPGGGSE